MAQEQHLTNVYMLNNAGEWKRFIGHVNQQQQFVGFPLAMVMYEAEHCHLCRESLPLVNELAGIYRGIISVGVVDIDKMVIAGTPISEEDKNKTIVSGVPGTPQFWMYRLGKPVDHVEGKDNERLKQMFAYWATQRPQ